MPSKLNEFENADQISAVIISGKATTAKMQRPLWENNKKRNPSRILASFWPMKEKFWGCFLKKSAKTIPKPAIARAQTNNDNALVIRKRRGNPAIK